MAASIDIVNFLAGTAAVQAIFGASGNTRIFAVRLDPEATVAYPFAIVGTVVEESTYAHDGPLPDQGIYQIDVFSDALTTVNSGTAALRTALSGITGAVGTITAGHSFIGKVREIFDADARAYKRSFDVDLSQNG